MSTYNQTVKRWLTTNQFPESIADELQKFNITKLHQIKHKSSVELAYMLEFLVQTESFKNRSNLMIPFKSAITDLYIETESKKEPMTSQKRLVGIPEKKEYKLVKVYENRNMNRNAVLNGNAAITLRYLPLYKCAYITYCQYINSKNIPKEYVETDNFKHKNPLKKWSGKVEVNEPFNLWAISYDPNNPKRAIYKSYKKICNTIYHCYDTNGFMEKALKIYHKKSIYITKRKTILKKIKHAKNTKTAKPVYKTSTNQYESITKPNQKWRGHYTLTGNDKYKKNSAQIGYFTAKQNKFARNDKYKCKQNSAQIGYFTDPEKRNTLVNIQNFIPRINKYKNKSEFEKAEFLLCWERLKNNEQILDSHYEILKWKCAVNYLFNFTSHKYIMNEMSEIINENMQTHQLRLKFFKSINKNGMEKVIEMYTKEKTPKANKQLLNESKEDLNESDNEIINPFEIEFKTAGNDENEMDKLVKSCLDEAIVNQSEWEDTYENITNAEQYNKTSHKLVITSKDETFIKESDLSNIKCNVNAVKQTDIGTQKDQSDVNDVNVASVESRR